MSDEIDHIAGRHDADPIIIRIRPGGQRRGELMASYAMEYSCAIVTLKTRERTKRCDAFRNGVSASSGGSKDAIRRNLSTI